MHQQSRHPPRVSSPASSPQTNPTRTNNPREAFSSSAAATRVRAGSDSGGGGSSAYDGSSTSEGTEWLGTGPSKDSIKKLDQVVQNLFYKTAILVVQSRLHLPPSNRKPNKWFQLETDELDVFRDELRVFRRSGTFDNRPPPMIIETYMDASRLSASQSLVVMDEYGKRWDVLEALNSSGSSSPGDNDRRNTEIILERWRIELKFIDNVDDLVEFQATLPTIYKRAVVFFRSLLVATRIMPCYKYAQQPFSKGKHAALELKCRILPAEPENPPSGFDPLRQPLIDGHSRDAVTDYMFGDLEVPVGRFYASVTYRNDCNFRVDDAESLLSSRFMGVDENFFKPSIGTQHRKYDYGEVGSLPSQRQSGYGQSQRAQEPLQTYGSLSTFHGEGALGTSPMTALKSVKAIGSDTSSPPSAAASIEVDPPHSLPIRPSTTRPSLRGVDGAHNRRPSVSFQPFKAGSLSGSPRLPESDAAGASGSPSSLTRPSGIANQARNRSSLTAGMAASLRTPGGVPTSTPAEGTSAGSGGTPIPVSASPRPVTSRYSSSFTHRRARPSFGTSVGQTKITPGITDDDQISSGKQSLSSSAAQPGSGLLTELGGNASSGGSFGPSIDDDNISEFLKALDSRKTLASFETSASGSTSGSKLDGSTAAKRTATQLYKFHLMRESNNALTESIQRITATTGTGGVSLSSSSGSGNLAGAASVTGTGKPLSPHTPHTPAIPSRLSENSIIDYQGDEQGRRGARRMSRLGKSTGTEEEVAEEEDEVEDEEDEDETPGPSQGDKERGARAIDIPLSPSGRIVHHGLVGVGGSTRRASSVAQKRNLAVKGVTRSNSSRGEELITNANADESDILLSEEMLAGGKRSISLGADDREAPSLSTLLAFQRQGTTDTVIPVAREEGQDNEDKDEEKDEAAGSAPRVFKTRRFTPLKRPSQSGNDEPSSGSASASASASGAGGNTGGAGSGEKQQRYGGNLLLGRALGAATAAAAAASGSGGSSSIQGPDDGGDDEPLLFAMSELERGPSRRSLEAARGGHGSGGATPGSGSREETSRRGSGDAENKATDENLTSEDWGAIMEVVDRVERDANGSKEAVQSMIKRLAHRNANVQLYTLEVANALSQNCGKPMHRELSSRAFTEALLKLANDRNTHNQVKAKILERMKEWTDMFKSDPDLGIMYDAYFRLKQTNPTLHPPSAPQKASLTQMDRQKEEEELQMALKLSLQEEERKKHTPAAAASSSAAGGSSGGGAAQAAAPQQQPMPSGTTAATVSRVRALFDFLPSEPGELEFKKGDVIAVLESVYKDWWRGSLKGKTGIFPLNYVEKLTDPTPDELQREAQMEAEVFAEIKNVEKLLTLLSASNTGPREEDNEEISKLYHQTLAIRPKLIKLIEKYSQKKDDFTQLNEKFIKARRDYEALLESSMSHPPGPSYHQYAMRPQIPQTYAPPGPGYGAPPPQQQDPQRFYTPAPGQEPSQYPTSSPSPNYQRPTGGPGAMASPAPAAPFFLAGAEVPAQPPNQAPVAPQQQQPPPQPQSQQQQQAPQQNQYPPQRPQEQRIPSGGPKPAPIQTSSPPPGAGQYAPYQPSAPQGGVRPQSTYGAPQELSTSVYDSPIAPHNAAMNSAATYSSSHYSTDDPYAAAAQSPVGLGGRTPSFPSAPTPENHNQTNNQRQSSYGQYSVYQTQPQPPGAYPGTGYDNGPADSSTSLGAIPPAPSGQAPPPPTGANHQRPTQPLSPPPLQPSGSAYDARQTLPSRVGGASSPGAAPSAPPGGGGPSQPQYKAYVPPGGSPGNAPGGGNSGGGAYPGLNQYGGGRYQPPQGQQQQQQQQGQQYPGGPTGGPGGEDNGPSAPSDYYRTAAY
ncbi:class E vacuolar protein-sorting machinery protein hse1 [Rhypophila decipiens]|uniref:Autophagy-related protein 13 n=1 Tax=Rhypophila decipiens TaxID=261697 RepID=A0AAN6YDR5_9PEZI|nr:class E vacuolar protein-sorting machinery protein hse1 [Rhypophila decipiens]